MPPQECSLKSSGAGGGKQGGLVEIQTQTPGEEGAQGAGCLPSRAPSLPEGHLAPAEVSGACLYPCTSPAAACACARG